MNIDDKLREILANLIKDYDRARKQSAYWTIEPENSIDQIHQAFVENTEISLTMAGIRNFRDGDGNEFMTGPEWYERFLDEFHQLPEEDYKDGHAYLKAARRAAGMDTEGLVA